MIAALIVACEITFWVVLLSGLTARYVLRRPGLGAVLLVATPLVDVALLAFTLVDLRDGATASTAHALAAVYIGISVAFGHRMVRWADARFAHRFAGVPAPPRPPRAGREHAAHERRGWLRHLVAWAIGVSLMLGGRALVGDADRTETLVQTAVLWTLILAIDFLVSFSYTLFPRRTHYPPEPGHDEPSSCADDRPRCGGGNAEGVHRVASSPGPTHRRAEHQEAADGVGPGAESRGRPVGQSYVVRLSADNQNARAVEALLRERGAPSTCRVLGGSRDGEELDLGAALTALVGTLDGCLLICRPGRLAYHESEDPGRRVVLARS